MAEPQNSGPFQRLLITGTQRTGSSALAEVVNTHPQIAVGWEWTERTAWAKKISVLDAALGGDFSGLDARQREQIVGACNSETRWLGCRRLFGASNKWLAHPRFSVKLMADRFWRHLDYIRANSDIRIVHIVRTDHLSWVKSKFVARAADSFVGGAYPDDLKVAVPLAEATSRVRAKLWIDEQLAELEHTNPYLRIDYERFAAELPELGREVARFLDVDPELIDARQTVIRKQSNRPDRDYISNYDELRRALNALSI